MATDLETRVGNGITWLTEHDPTGRYHLWFQGRVLPGTPMPAQTPEAMAEYRAYYRAREQWERLFKALEREEAAREKEQATTGSSESEPVLL